MKDVNHRYDICLIYAILINEETSHASILFEENLFQSDSLKKKFSVESVKNLDSSVLTIEGYGKEIKPFVFPGTQ